MSNCDRHFFIINSTKEPRNNRTLSVTASNKVAKDAVFDSLPSCLVCADTRVYLLGVVPFYA